MYFKNEVTVEGWLCQKPELKTSKNGKNYCFFTVCYNESRKEGEEWKNTPHFFKCSTWNREAEKVCEMEKGTPVSVIGKLTENRWTDSNGNPKSRILVQAFHVRKFDISKSENEKIENEIPVNTEEETIEPPEIENELPGFDVF